MEASNAASSLAAERALVTGASGFIGRALCRRLAELGMQVHGVSRTEQEDDASVQRWWKSSMLEPGDVRAMLEAVRPDVIFHLAGNSSGSRDPELVVPIFHSNLHATVNLLSAAQQVGCRRILLTGSLEEPDPTSQWPIPSSPYAAAKFAAGTYGRMFHALYETPVVLMRVFMVYGPGQRETYKLIPHVILSLLNGESPRLSSGKRAVDWIYVDDVVSGFVAAATAPGIEGCTVDIGTGKLETVREVVNRITDLIRPEKLPEFGAADDRPMEQIRRAKIESARALGWRADVSLDEGLRRTIEWYRGFRSRI